VRVDWAVGYSKGPTVNIERLARVNRTQTFIATLGVVVVGLFAPGWVGALVLFALVAALLAMLVRTTPAARPGAVLVRLAILVGLGLIALTKIW
jgi:hypothetical protein